MGSDVSSGLVLFIAALAVAAVAAGAMTKVVGSMANELHDRGEGLALAIGTDLAIVNDPDNVPYDGGAGELTVYVKNTGSTKLVAEEVMVMVDGEHRSFTSTLLDGASSWTTGVVAELTVSVSLASGDHTVRVVHTPNVADTMDFRV